MNNIKQKMIQISDDFSLIAEHLKEQLSKNALQGDVEHFNKNKTKHDYLTELSNIMANLKVEAQEERNYD
ncbi:hypothetical protein BCU39_008360 [Vibrio cyclitrophicus]|uniref:hypothetical protein n=1 Tax=Vibrio cyclitrophicus TaxID=47951 RepID=UPI000C8549A3|nr:hypothetical protein [Vibrio cyclitrophicus]PMI70282.1 hypothetical protein BCU39_04970 [Vibrio cyclitrophicus]